MGAKVTIMFHPQNSAEKAEKLESGAHESKRAVATRTVEKVTFTSELHTSRRRTAGIVTVDRKCALCLFKLNVKEMPTRVQRV